MKSVILIRHIKSDWTDIVPDFDRPIREDRKHDAALVAKTIAKRNDIPQVIIASPAKRTLQTAKAFCKNWHFKTGSMIVTNKVLYECTAATILNVINTVDEQYSAIAIVCHNPAITDFVNTYTNLRIDNVPTTGAVKIEFDVQLWAAINGAGIGKWFINQA